MEIWEIRTDYCPEDVHCYICEDDNWQQFEKLCFEGFHLSRLLKEQVVRGGRA